MNRNITPRFYRLPDLQVIFCKQSIKATRSIYRQQGFPDPIRVGREYLWPVDAVERFITEHPTGRVTRAPRTTAGTSRPVGTDKIAELGLPLIRIGKAVA